MRLPIFAFLALAVGCAKKPNDDNMDRPKQPQFGENTGNTDNEWRTTYIDVGESIPSACGLTVPKAFFGYDSANLTPSATNMMNELAECMTNGPLKGETITLVGHADPRGDDAYNKQLGMSRADAVRDSLVKNGIDSSRINMISRGEMAANMDPRGWRYDRRVDIRLASEMNRGPQGATVLEQPEGTTVGVPETTTVGPETAGTETDE